MRIFRFLGSQIFESKENDGLCAIISGDEHKHLSQVLRLKESAVVEVIDPYNNALYYGEIVKIDEADTLIKLTNKLDLEHLDPLTVIVPLIKPNLCELIVEKCAEIGISEINFYHAKRSQIKFKEKSLNTKIDRFNRIAASSLKQSGTENASIPQINIYDNLSDLLAEIFSKKEKTGLQEKRIVFSAPKRGKSVSIIDVLSGNSGKDHGTLEKQRVYDDISIAIGPPGGLSDEELDALLAYDFEYASLGPKVLRTETAAIVASSICVMQLHKRTNSK